MQTPNSGQASPGRSRPVGEFDVIERLRARFESAARVAAPGTDIPPPGDTWIGDDAAVVRLGPAGGSGQVVLATDLVVEGVHLDLRYTSPPDAGYKALMVALSDLAAMGARPYCALVSVAGPTGCDLDGLGSGVAEAAAATGCAVVGGDLSRAPALVISAAVLGLLDDDVPGGPLLRSAARPGDRLFVTGPLGASAAGLRLLADGGAEGRGGPGPAPDLVRAHCRPVARLDEGIAARSAGAGAAIDVSDGFAADVRHLARASGVGLDLAGIPVAEGATPDEALHGGEDYELVVATGDPERLLAAFARAGLRAPHAIGTCTPEPRALNLEGNPLPAGGWEHSF